MKPTLYILTIVTGLALMAACKKEPPPPDPTENVDYREMLTKVREREDNRAGLNEIKDALKEFQRDAGRMPSNLVELVKFRYLEKLPDPPEGMDYVFDDVTGNIRQITVNPRLRRKKAEEKPPTVQVL